MNERQHDRDRAEAAAFLRKALGLERALDRLRHDGDGPVATLRRVPRRADAPAQNRTPTAA